MGDMICLTMFLSKKGNTTTANGTTATGKLDQEISLTKFNLTFYTHPQQSQCEFGNRLGDHALAIYCGRPMVGVSLPDFLLCNNNSVSWITFYQDCLCEDILGLANVCYEFQVHDSWTYVAECDTYYAGYYNQLRNPGFFTPESKQFIFQVRLIVSINLSHCSLNRKNVRIRY